MLTVFVAGGRTRSPWLAGDELARARILLDGVGDDRYQINLADPVVAAVLGATDRSGQFRIFGKTEDGEVVASIAVRYSFKRAFDVLPKVFVYAAGERHQVFPGPHIPGLPSWEEERLEMLYELWPIPYLPSSELPRRWFSPEEVETLEVQFKSGFRVPSAEVRARDKSWPLVAKAAANVLVLAMRPGHGCVSHKARSELDQDENTEVRSSLQAGNEMSEDLRKRIEGLIDKLEWSRGIGSHGFGVPGTGSERELTAIGRPAIPFLLPVLTEDRASPPYLSSRKAVAVEILGAIGDKEVTPAILDAMEAKVNRRDVSFVSSGIQALGELGDERALPALRELTVLSAVACEEGMKGVDTEPPDGARWWFDPRQFMSGVQFSLLWDATGTAIGRIGGEEALKILEDFLSGQNKYERVAGVVGLAVMLQSRDPLSEKVRALLERTRDKEHDAEIRALVAAVLSEERGQHSVTAELALELRGGIVQLIVAQRQTKSVPRSEGHLLVHLGDISRGGVPLTLTTDDGKKLFDTPRARAGDSFRFRVGEHEYWLSVLRLVNLLVGNDYAVLAVSVSTYSAEMGSVEKQVLSLIEILRTSRVVFIRNEKEYTPAEGAAHIRAKYEHAKEEIETLEEFIDKVASHSWLSGKPYLVKLPDGRTLQAKEWLRKQPVEISEQAAEKE